MISVGDADTHSGGDTINIQQLLISVPLDNGGGRVASLADKNYVARITTVLQLVDRGRSWKVVLNLINIICRLLTTEGMIINSDAFVEFVSIIIKHCTSVNATVLRI